MIDEKIKQLKKEHGEIIVLESEGKVAFLKKPTRQVVSYALTLQQQGKSLEMLEHVMKNCFVDGDREFCENIDYILGSAEVINELVSVKQVTIKKY